MKGILGILLGGILFVLIVLAILFHKTLKNFKKMARQAADNYAARKQAKEDEYFKRTSNKYYHKEEEVKFKDDYFKTVDEEPKPRQEQPKKKTTTRRTVHTGNGVTIIDDRSEQKSDRKIFESGEGEYVEFEEV